MVSWGLKFRTQQPIGLDISHHSIKIIQLDIDDEQISVIAADEAHIDTSKNTDEQSRKSFIVSTIKRMLTSGGFQGRNVVSCLPSDKLRITSLRLAETEGYDIEQVLRKEVAHRFELDPDKDSMDYMVAGSVRQGDEVKNELILFATDNETIKNHIEMLEETGLRPVAIDTIPCALFRSFERSLRRQDDWDRTAVFVDVGSSSTTVVFGRGGEISFVKQIQIGREKFINEISSKLGISIAEAEMLHETLRMDPGLFSPKSDVSDQTPNKNLHNIDMSTRQVIVDAVSAIAEELVREISLCLRYYTVTFRGKRVERAVFSGDGAYEDILLNVLKRRLAIEIELAQPLRGFDLTSGKINVDLNSNTQGLFCEWAVVVGLGLKKWDRITGGRRQAKCGSREIYERN